MKRKISSQRTFLGIFVFTGVLIFLFGVYFIGKKQNLFANTSTVISIFNNVNGLQEGNNVRYAGVNVGIVKNITILNDTIIGVEMSIEDQILKLIKKDSRAAISSDGLVGSMVINILPGDKMQSMIKPLKDGDTIFSVKKVATSDMLEILNTTNNNAARLTEDLLKITNAINQGQGVLGVLINDREVASNFQNTMENLNTSSKIAIGTIKELNSELSGINFSESAAGLLLKDTATAKRVESLIVNLEKSSKEINEISSEIKLFSKGLNSERGVLNYIVKDTSLPANLDQTLKNLELASKNLNENMEALKHNFLFRGYFRKLERQQKRREKN